MGNSSTCNDCSSNNEAPAAQAEAPQPDANAESDNSWNYYRPVSGAIGEAARATYGYGDDWWRRSSWRDNSQWGSQGDAWHAQSSYSSGSGYAGKEDDPPSWDGKSMPRSDYFRKIRIWEATTRMDCERRGPKLLAGLSGVAFYKMEMVEPEDLAVWNGVKERCVTVNSQRMRVLDGCKRAIVVFIRQI